MEEKMEGTMTHRKPTPAELIEKIRRALDSFSRYMGDTGCACDTTRDDYLNADVALHTLEALFTATQVSAEKVFCAFLNNMTVDANALPIVTLDKPKIMAAIQAAMLSRTTIQETNLVPEKTPSSTDNVTPRDRATRDKISQVVLKWYGQTIQAAIGELLALHDTSPPTDGLRSAREYAEAFSTEWGAYFTIKDLQDAAHAKWVDIFEQWAKRIQQNAITSQSEKLREAETKMAFYRGQHEIAEVKLMQVNEKLRVMREAMQGMLDLFEQNKTRLGLRYEQMLPVRNAKAALADKE